MMNQALPGLIISLLMLSLVGGCAAKTATNTSTNRQIQEIQRRIKKHRAQDQPQAAAQNAMNDASGATR
jgi:hypothetical protein